MYSSVASLHIALSNRIQQQNSNRKEAIFPEQYDMVLNDAIQIVLKSRIASDNYVGLQSIKKIYSPTIYLDTTLNKWYFELPSDYYIIDSLQSNIIFDKKNTILNVKDTTQYKTIIHFNNIGTNSYTFQKDIIRYITPTKTIFPENINLVSASNKSSFYYFNIIKEYIKSKEGINCYFENYLGEYYNNSLIFISDTNNIPTSVSVKDITDNNIINITDKIIVTSSTNILKTNGDISETSINLGNKKIDEVSSLDDANESTDFYRLSNRHLNPKCVINTDKVFLTTDTKFSYSNIRLDYLKQPRLIDSRINQMTDIEITEDVLDVATQLLMRTLNIKDPIAEQEAAQQQKQK